MPEYLAPGVYVEEVSFRAKSIEGVSTSTTAFVGPARKGPVIPALGVQQPAVFELLTSFGDFVRIYGGLEPLEFAPAQPNYLAQAALNFFNEGGARLYVARVASPDAAEARAVLAGDANNATDPERVVARARYPGAAGRGSILVREILSPANLTALQNAPTNALLRAAGAAPVEPARVTATQAGPYALPNGTRLRLIVNNNPLDFTFQAQSTEATAQNDLPEPAAIDPARRTLTVTFGQEPDQVIPLEANYATRQELVSDLNRKIRGGYARLQGLLLVIGIDQRGHAGRVRVAANQDLGFDPAVDVLAGVADRISNNVGDLANVTAIDLNFIFGAGSPVQASNQAGRLVLATTQPGQDQTLAVADATNLTPGLVSAHTGLRLPVPAPGEPPARGSSVRLYWKQAGGAWNARDGTPFPPPPDNTTIVGNIISLAILAEDGSGDSEVFDEVSLIRGEPRYLGRVLRFTPPTRDQQLRQSLWFDIGDNVDTLELHNALFPSGIRTGRFDEGFTCAHRLQGGGDGPEPQAGAPDQAGTYAAAFEHLLALEDVSIVAAPGHSAYQTANYQAIQGLLRAHVERPRAFRIGVLDTPPNLTPSLARQERARIDSTRVALYYPWVTVANPLARPGRDDIPREINLPPSGFICGIYARNDALLSVSKAPANEVVRGALRFERDINHAENQLLNPLGVNCLRFFPGRGYRVWGARTASSDPEWKYVNVRRYFIYLEASIDRGTQWAVFENNGERLWANVRETVESFLYNEWVSGNLLGGSPKEAFFVRCDRSTMTQNDLDNGRLICLIGVAVLKPAEFVIFRIGQKTADARS